MKFIGAALAVALCAATAGPASSQTAPDAQTPQRTTATYDDWTVRCEIRTAPPQKLCEMVQATQTQGQAAPVSQIAIGRPVKTEPVKMVVQVPINIWLPSGLKFMADDKDAGLSMVYKRCIPSACLTDTDLKDDVIKKYKAATGNGKLVLKDATQQEVAIPVSFKGFVQAFDAISKD